MTYYLSKFKSKNNKIEDLNLFKLYNKYQLLKFISQFKLN